MPNAKEVLRRISSIQDTMKITNAMYLISSSKLRTAKKNMEGVSDYFRTMQEVIRDILMQMPELKHRYFDNDVEHKNYEAKRAYVIITSDKGLAGSYNQAVIKHVEDKLSRYKNATLYVIGQVGYHHFEKSGYAMERDFIYSSKQPSLQRARNITMDIIDLYESGKVDEVYVMYTKMETPTVARPHSIKLLPLNRVDFEKSDAEEYCRQTAFFPSPEAVMDEVAPIYMHGIIFSAMTESYSAELSARMSAMDAARKNAEEMIRELKLVYNRTRQAAITNEITEVVSGAKAFQSRRKSAMKNK